MHRNPLCCISSVYQHPLRIFGTRAQGRTIHSETTFVQESCQEKRRIFLDLVHKHKRRMISVATDEDRIGGTPCLRKIYGITKANNRGVTGTEESKFLKTIEPNNMFHQNSRSSSSPLCSTGGDSFWTICWDDGSKCALLPHIVTNQMSEPFSCRSFDIMMTNDGVHEVEQEIPRTSRLHQPQHNQEKTPILSRPICNCPSQSFNKEARKKGHRVRFSKTNEYRSTEIPLTPEEGRLYFWSDSENERMKMERQVLMANYRNQFKFNGASFWNDMDGSV